MSSSKPSGSNAADEILQAVIIGDSYNSRFKPLTEDRPRCLIPLANRPLIDYTIEFLASSGVQEIFIFICSHAEQIRNYIRQSTWSTSGVLRIELILTPDSTSVGDAMRRLDEEQKIKSDFLLLSGDVVSNLSGSAIVKAHKERREIDKSCIMTMVLRETGSLHRARTPAECPLLVLAGEYGRCVHYARASQPRSAEVCLDTSLFRSYDHMQVRNDLVDCNIDVCSPEVPALFSENFDYNDMRQDFVHGILTSDLLGKTIHCHIDDDKYAARVQDLRTYDAVTRDIVSRWTYPITPETSVWAGDEYAYEPQNIYKGANVRLARLASLQSNLVLGPNVKIGDESTLAFSTVGADCSIGSNCKLTNCHLWNNVQIGQNCTIDRSIIADHVVIGDNCSIAPGTVLGTGVVLSNGTTTVSGMKLVAVGEVDVSLVGRDGLGRLYAEIASDEDSDSDEENVDLTGERAQTTESCSGLCSYNKELCYSDLSVSSIGSQSHLDVLRRPSFAASAQSEDDSTHEFYDLARADLETAFTNNHHVDDVMLELTSLRMRENVGMHEVRIAILDVIIARVQDHQSSNILNALKQLITRWAPLVQRTISANTIIEDCLDILLSLQRICSAGQESNLFVPFTKFMYDAEVLPEEAILAWYEDARSRTDQAMQGIRSKATAFVDWLQEAEEISSDESD